MKNRTHLDLRPKDQAAEVARLEALGAPRGAVGQGPDVTWVVLADPDGNEFCVLRAFRPDELANWRRSERRADNSARPVDPGPSAPLGKRNTLRAGLPMTSRRAR